MAGWRDRTDGAQDAGRRGRLRVGTSGWQYDHWRGRFYPKDLPKHEWFAYYAERFDAVEINNTFHHLPDAKRFGAWRRAAPDDFCYALKFSRYGTHLKHLKAPRGSVRRFLARARRLRGHLGPILVQLPPRWKPEVERLDAFLAATSGRERWVVELRDARWLCDEVYDVLVRHGAALCVHDLIDDHPRIRTADFVYLRFHGERYRGGYAHQRLAAEARRIAELLSEGVDAYVYFNNDLGGHAVVDAERLRGYVEKVRD